MTSRDDLQRLPGEQSAGLFQLPEVQPIHEFHHEVVQAIHMAKLVQRNDVGMAQLGQRAGLAREALREPRVPGGFHWKNLERHQPVNLALPRFIDCAHAAGAEQFDDFKLQEVPGNVFQRRRCRRGPFRARAKAAGFTADAHLHQAFRAEAARRAGWHGFAAMRTFACFSHKFSIPTLKSGNSIKGYTFGPCKPATCRRSVPNGLGACEHKSGHICRANAV